MEAEAQFAKDDGGTAVVAIRRGLHDLRQGLQLELERLEALLAIPRQGYDASEDEQELKTTLPGLDMVEEEGCAGGHCGRSTLADSDRPKTPRRTPRRGLPYAATEIPTPPDAGSKPEPPAWFQVIATQVPEPPEPGSRPLTPAFTEPGGMAEMLSDAEDALAVKAAPRGLQSLVEFPSPPLQPGGSGPLEPQGSAESLRSAPVQGGAGGVGAATPGSASAASSRAGGPNWQVNTALLTPASREDSERWRSQTTPLDVMGRTMTKLKSLRNMKTSPSLQAFRGDGVLQREEGGFVSGEMAHYKRTYDMEKRKQELMRSKSTIAKAPKTKSQLLKDSVWHHYFEAFFATAILSSALVYGAEVQYSAHHPYDVQPVGFFVLHVLFTIVFLVELVLRMYTVGVQSFLCRREHFLWGWLDVFLCAASVLECILGMAILIMADGDGVRGSDPVRIVRMFRVLRMSRAFRLQRFMWFVSALRTLVYSIAATLKSLFWAMVLLLTIIYVFAMCFTQFTIDFSIDPEADVAAVQEMKLYWGSLDRSMLTLFQSIAGGVSWREAALPMEEVSIFILLLFVLYIAFVYFAVLNIVTGVFCSSAIETTQRTPELIARSLIDDKHNYEQELKKLFHSIDTGNTGLITLSEFESLQGDEMTLAYFRALEINFADAWSIFKLIDEDKGGAIEIDEFVRGCQQLRGGASSLEIQELAFDLRKLSEKLQRGLHKTDEQLEELRVELQGAGGKDVKVTKMKPFSAAPA